MRRVFLLAGLASVCTAFGALGQDMTVTEYVSGPSPGDIKEVTEMQAKEEVQASAGVHKGHRILHAKGDLCKEAKTPYSINYTACLETGKHPGSVDLIAKEGLSGLGLVGAGGANWYPGGCIDLVINGKSLKAYRPRMERVVYASGAVTVRAAWNVPWGRVGIDFTQMPDGDCCYVKGTVDCPEVHSMVVELKCYPWGYAEPRKRAAWTASVSRIGPGAIFVPPRDTWIVYGDIAHETAKGKREAGPCAVMFSPLEIHSAKVNVSDYPVSTDIVFRPELKEIHLALWEFPGLTNEQAQERLRTIAAGLKREMGRAAPVAVVEEGAPERAIVVEGQPAASILLRREAQDRELEAAIELQDYIAKATGAILPIVAEPEQPRGHVIKILVRDPGEGESSEAFSISVSSKETRITGNSPLAALYGVYELLESGVGVRWYLPGPLGEIVPKCKTLVLPPLDLKQSPSFAMRWIGKGEWMLRNKQNRCEDGFWICPGIYHTQSRLLPHSQYFKEHPEYFALIKGKRSEERECKLCYFNPDVVREVAKNMAKMLDENPNIKLISLSPTDGQLWCECDGCKAMDEADVPKDQAKSRRSLLFYNAVAAELRKTHPEAKMLVGAYNVYNWPPRDAAIKADSMISVIITHYENYCMAHPVADAACPLNQRYVQLIKAWQGLGCQIYFYEYYWKVNWLDLPWPIVHSIKGDMPWYKNQGCQGVYTQYSESSIWSTHPAHYAAARLLWDVNVDVDAIVDKMYDDLFGEAAPSMKAYYALMEKQMAECGEHFPGRGIGFGPAVFTDEVRVALRGHYENAVKANRDETVGLRLQKIGTSLEYVDRLMSFIALTKKTAAETDPEKALASAEEALKVGEALYNEVRKDREKWNGVVSTSVVGTGYFGRTLDNWRKVVEKKRKQVGKVVDRIADLPVSWKFALDPQDMGQKEDWFKTEFDDSAWKAIEIGKTWESQGYEYDGFAWYRVAFEVKPEWAKMPLAIHFGAVDGEAWVYWNGVLLGHHEGWDEPFALPIKPELIRRDGPNIIAVRVYDGANAGGIYKMVSLTRQK